MCLILQSLVTSDVGNLKKNATCISLYEVSAHPFVLFVCLKLLELFYPYTFVSLSVVFFSDVRTC